MREQNIKVTTTSTFDNIDITEYLEPVSAHVVIGMNAFKDFFSGFTDVFGGNSNIYENTLSSMSQQVIGKLRKKANSIGANCIVGLRIDNDEISAQGKSMMMVTATGTAAIAKFSEKKSFTIDAEKKLNSLNIDEYLILNQKKVYQKKCDEKKIKTRQNDEFWKFIKSNRMSEFAIYVINNFEDSNIDYVDTTTETSLEQKKNVVEYFSLIEPEISKKILYNKLNSSLNEKIRKSIENIVKQTYLIDYTQIYELLKNSDFEIQKSTFKLGTYQKMSYEYSDIVEIKNIIDFANVNFPKRGEIATKKKLLSSKEQEIWICECGKECYDNIEYCNKCRKDIYGFKKDEIKPKELINLLEDKVDILNETLKK